MTARLLAGVLALALCACATQADLQSLHEEIRELKGDGGGAVPSNARVAELGAQIAELREEVSQLRGAVEEAQHAADQALSEARTSSAAPGRLVAPAPVPAAPADPPGSLSSEVRSYEEAFRLYRAEDYTAAIDRFQGFLQSYPSSDYADNALFWLGECHFKLGDQEQAVLAFDDVVKRYPEGNKVPDALYRQGTALMEIGDRTGKQDTYRPAARQIFQRLVDDYPQSDRVPEARRQLEKLAK